MKPAPFRYASPHDVGEALELLSDHGHETKVLAGGQSLVPMMNLRLAQPAVLVDINRLESLASLEERGDGSWFVGALVRHATLERIEPNGPVAALLKRAAGEIGHLPIRLRGSIGGSLVHADPAAEWPALVMAMEGTLVLQSARGTRRVPASEFPIGPYMTSICDDELLTGIELPAPPPWVAMTFAEVSRRPGDFATALSVVRLVAEGGVVTSARVVVGGMPGGPIRCPAAEHAITGVSIEAVVPGAVGDASRESCHAYDDAHASAAYRVAMAAVVVADAVSAAIQTLRHRNGAGR
jgi:aerobic carbon-monoxide dehydrogenase medium subunit